MSDRDAQPQESAPQEPDPEVEPSDENPPLDWSTAPGEFREHAESLMEDLKRERDEREEERKELAQHRRRDAFERAAHEAGISDVGLEDLEDVPPNQITADLVRIKAEEKREAKDRQLEEFARELGYESADAYQAAHSRLKKLERAESEARYKHADLAMTGSALRPIEHKTPEEHAREAAAEAKAAGQPDDEARASYLRALRENRERPEGERGRAGSRTPRT